MSNTSNKVENELFILYNNGGMAEIGEDSEKFDHQLNLLEEWLKYQKHLPQNITRKALAHYLRGTKMNLEKAKRKLEICCYLPLTYEKFYKNRDATLEGDLKSFDFVYIVPMPVLTAEGYMVFIIKPYNNDLYNLLTTLRYSLMLIDYLCYNNTPSMGVVLLVDLELCQLPLIIKIFVPTFFQCTSMFINSYPIRIKQVLLIIGNPLLEKAVTVGLEMCKAILPKKLRNRIFVLSTKDDLSKYMSEKYLPSDYSGSQKSLSEFNAAWREVMIKNAEFFENLSKMMPRGEIPPYVPQCDDTLGVDGSFRKLNVD